MGFASTLYSHFNLPTSYSHFLPSKSKFGLKTPNALLSYASSPSKKMPYHKNVPPFSSSKRFLVLPSVSGIWNTIIGAGGSSQEALLAIRRGMLLFRQGDVPGSLVEFDRAIELDPRQKAYLWQRGLTLYYLDRFEEGAEQFRIDVAQNPNDTEESIWCFLCEAQLYGVDEARRRFLEASQCLLGTVGRDPRPVMRESYDMFKDGGDPEKLVSAFLLGKEHEFFYASLYAGLYYESQVYSCNPSLLKFM
ncbi:hypothetical protein IFM89_003904 [Coptis chinensis]|uniref:Uncharacterized protein n=1 Tax=Coptis chinensis TaxID=261450 RepID=A0A835MCS2_9MAGN|nr:hypothetical protein IFM89_003904 [Coptis chinensis]